MSPSVRIDSLQYCHWNRQRFLEMRAGGLHAVHATICYHENFRETMQNIARWNDLFLQHADLIFHGKTATDVQIAQTQNRTAIFFGFQNCSPLEDDIRMLEIWRDLGVKFMQLTYNNQSLLAAGYCEDNDGGITRMGKQVIAEMNRLGMVVDMSHAGETSVLQAAQISQRPIAITHANPAFWHPAKRNLSLAALRALSQNGGMLGLSLYPHHLRNGANCTLQSFCEMAIKTADIIGVQNIGIGSDLCRGQPDSVLHWMRAGKWQKTVAADTDVFPTMPPWFTSADGFNNLQSGLSAAGFSEDETNNLLGNNWLRFFEQNFTPMP